MKAEISEINSIEKYLDGILYFDDREAVIYGCNIYTKCIRDWLSKHNISLVGILDNDVNKQGNLFLHVMIFSPNDMVNKDKKYVYLIYSSHWRGMKEDLISRGIADKDIIVIPYKTEVAYYDDSLCNLLFKSALMHKCYKEYKSLYRRAGKPEIFIVFPYKGTGDVYNACSYLDKYIKKKGYKHFELIVPNNNCKNVVKLFGYEDIIVESSEKISELIDVWTVYGADKVKVKPLLHWGWRVKHKPWVYDNINITLGDMYKGDVFGLSEEIKPILPIFNKGSSYAEKLFQKLGLEKGKTVIISPYANSADSEIRDELWVRMAKGLKDRGYNVCTNCAGEETPIEGTQKIFFPYEEATNVLEYAGGFVAIRSGLCEIVSSANCKMVIFYENGNKSLSYNFLSLKKMGLCENEIPIVFTKDDDIEKVFDVWS
ncbi:hypothetical protein [Butyrivibrio fibrisolvens]|uniref:hypothetical protein n=1 Tax=Butyrivibrio fibrisolvens TaxID=831 RepID=UPI0003B3FD6F|nr:hypothetical protein [Butyrivibrio fibrisolvens]